MLLRYSHLSIYSLPPFHLPIQLPSPSAPSPFVKSILFLFPREIHLSLIEHSFLLSLSNSVDYSMIILYLTAKVHL